MTFELSIMTPERQFFSGQVEALTVTGIDGQMTVLAGHAPMVVSLDIGEISIKQDGTWRQAVNTEGFMEVLGDSVVMFVQACEWPEDIDVRRAEEAKHRAELTLQDAHIKAGQIEANARRSIVEEQKVLEGIQEEVSAFKARLIEIYKEHIALIQSLPGKVEAEEPEPERAEEPEDQETVDFAAMQEPEAPAEIPQPDGEEKAAAEIDKKFEEREADVPVSMFSTLKFGEDYDVTKDPS